MIEMSNTYHSNPLNEAILMIPKLLKFNHWIPRYYNFKNFKFLIKKSGKNLRKLTKIYENLRGLRKFTSAA